MKSLLIPVLGAAVASSATAAADPPEDPPGLRSACNSAALLRHPQIAAQTDWVRPGIALYGSSPDAPEHDIAHWNLQSTMSLRSRIIVSFVLLGFCLTALFAFATNWARMRVENQLVEDVMNTNLDASWESYVRSGGKDVMAPVQ